MVDRRLVEKTFGRKDVSSTAFWPRDVSSTAFWSRDVSSTAFWPRDVSSNGRFVDYFPLNGILLLILFDTPNAQPRAIYAYFSKTGWGWGVGVNWPKGVSDAIDRAMVEEAYSAAIYLKLTYSIRA